MKKIICLFILGLMASVHASPFTDALAAKDYLTASRYISINSNMLSVCSVDQARLMYNAATNDFWKFKSAMVAHALGDRSLLVDYLGKVVPSKNEDGTIESFILYNIHALNPNKYVTTVIKKGKEVVVPASLNIVEPELMLSFYNRMKSIGNYEVCSFACITPSVFESFIKSTFTPEINDSLESISRRRTVFRAFTYFDINNNDKNYSLSTPFYTEKFATDYSKVINKLYMFNLKTKINEFYKLVIKNNIHPEVRFNAAKRLDKMEKTNKYVESVYPGLDDKSVKLDAAIYLDDVDKIIDSLLVADDYTASQVNEVIAPLNAVAADYRKSDILKALQNINSRCTVKLYDDQKSWEPIIAKVRAMIDVRK